MVKGLKGEKHEPFYIKSTDISYIRQKSKTPQWASIWSIRGKILFGTIRESTYESDLHYVICPDWNCTE